MGNLISRLHDAAERLGASGKDGTRAAVARMQGLERSFLKSVEDAGLVYEDGEIVGIRDEEEEEKEGEGVDKRDSRKYNGTRHYDYTKEQYEAYGWVRANDVLSTDQYRDFVSKFADVVSKGYAVEESLSGEYMIPISGLNEDVFGIDNTIVFARGTIERPEITRIIKIALDEETLIIPIREYIIEYEKTVGTSDRAAQIYYGEEIIGQVSRDDFANYREYSDTARRRSGRNGSRNSKKLVSGETERGGDTSEAGSTVTRKSKKVTAEQDAAYMKAVEDGDMETAQRVRVQGEGAAEPLPLSA